VRLRPRDRKGVGLLRTAIPENVLQHYVQAARLADDCQHLGDADLLDRAMEVEEVAWKVLAEAYLRTAHRRGMLRAQAKAQQIRVARRQEPNPEPRVLPRPASLREPLALTRAIHAPPSRANVPASFTAGGLAVAA